MKNNDSASNKTSTIKKISKHDFYFETPLYQEIKYSAFINPSELLAGDIDAYSSKNKTETTYGIDCEWVRKLRESTVSESGRIHYIYSGFQYIKLQCKRKSNDTLWVFIYNDQINKTIIKIGQYPSIADLQFSDLERKYDKVLEENFLSEFKKAIVSASHGYGVAAFIYLRRIFENLILRAFIENESALKLTEKEFTDKKMEDKIDTLKLWLPSQLMEMKSVYGILSKGVHELDEQVCSSYFSPLKLSIELILDQKIEIDLKKKRDENVKNEIQQIASLLGKK